MKHFVILGDINLDWCVTEHLPFSFSELAENGIITWAEIDELPGGSGLNFAVFSQKEGYRPLLIGKVGEDLAGTFLRNWLAEHHLAEGVSTVPEAGTGKAMIVRDSRDVRFLVNNSRNANHFLCDSDIDRHAEVIGSCSVLYISGFCIKDETSPRYSATLKAIEYARNSLKRPKPVVVFDVVPHRLYETYSFEQFRKITAHVDILISEVATVRRFLSLGSRDEHIDRPMILETIERLRPYYQRLVLRFGRTGCDSQVLIDTELDCQLWEETGHDKAMDKRGVGDSAAIRALRDFFHILPDEKKN